MQLLIIITLLGVATIADASARPHPELPLPAGLALTDSQGRDAGLRFVDLNGDGHEDIVLSNGERFGVYLYNDVEKKGLGWTLGWPHEIRAGKAGEALALPLTTSAGVEFRDHAMWVDGRQVMTFAELCRPPAPPARSPAESLRALHLKPGLVADLVAHEPLVQDPIFIDWDAQGRMWVVEMADYPFHEQAGQIHHGRVKILTDSDGDGVYDRSALFLDDLQYPTGLALCRGGAYIASVPEVFYAEDSDGDGRADIRRPVLQGFKLGNPQHLVNGFAWGLDGWLYGGNGDSGGVVKDLSTGREHDLSGRDFRFHPQTGEFQLQSGRAQYGRWRDDFGNWFANNNSNLGWHYFIEDRYLARNRDLAVRSVKQDLNRHGTALFPVSAPMRRLNQAHAINTLTSGCSPMPYRDSVLLDEDAPSLFICEPANNLVHRELLQADGVSFISHRAADESTSEFLASEDNWSRFTQARTGPDGCLYVVDFYRLILEHPEWIPKQMLAHLDLRAGSDRGRIYRIRPQSMKPKPMINLAMMTDAELGEQLLASNGPIRDIAQRLLMERGSTWHRPELVGTAAAQIQQLWTMHGLGQLPLGLLHRTMDHSDSRLREQAARIAEDYADAGTAAALSEMVKDSDFRVRVQVANSLGFCKPHAAVDAALMTLSERDGDASPMLIALLSSAPRHPLAATWHRKLKASQGGAVVVPVAPVIVNNNADRSKVVQGYSAVAQLQGDAQRGHALFTAVCSSCHRLKGEGNELGPDLGTVAGKPMEQLIEAILDPNRAVEQRYLAHTVTLIDGKQITGMIAEETANSITVKLGANAEVILRHQIRSNETTTRSLMPEGLESVLSPQQVADVLAWMR
jgi:putative membrane-bound dehydrogenase-like protein